ncbi:peptidoglycan DD-metalloendopeptidase family protein [Alphaproteobacteria bacterium]|nr:peptidoglycan DD-metalloendopeptidase family protein [Alphaproteobacteria bacterium]
MSRVLFLSILMCFVGTQAFANPPLPKRKLTQAAIENNLRVEREQQEELARKAKSIESELDNMRGDLVKVGRDVQQNEKTLLELEDKIKALEKEKSDIQANLDKERQSISRLIVALQRISRVPPQALIARPDAPLKTAQGHMLMRDIIPALNKQAESLQQNLARLDSVGEELVEKRKQTVDASKDLEEEQARLEKLASKKEDLYRSANKDLKAQESEVQRISLNAKTLGDLVSKLEKSNEAERTRSLGVLKKNAAFKKPSIKLPKSGNARLPIPGVITTSFNDPDNFGAPSKGISIKARENALVVAPMGGIIRFAGHFKNYGNMVIIEHQDKYHSLIAGFEKIDTLVGQKITVGEPLGRIHSQKSGKPPKLYYELRYKGKPIDPSRKISGMG